MLKLKYLFDNHDLAQMILSNWEYDSDDPNLLKYFRISSNAVYWFRNHGTTFLLRFSPAEEKSKEYILAELEFLRYLKGNGYSVADTILSKHGNEVEEINTPWGLYYASAFKRVPGKSLEDVPISDELIFKYGKALGYLHKLSSKYVPANYRRKDWKDTMDWMEAELSNFPDEAPAKEELRILKNYFTKLPVTKENFGLVHYDFEPDNVFYDDTTKTLNAIDFDDAVYHWYAVDIEQVFDSLNDIVPEDQIEAAAMQFIKGYRTEYDISDDMLKLLPVFRRYINLYGYVRLCHSSTEKWDNEPEWLTDLRVKLHKASSRYKSGFGKTL